MALLPNHISIKWKKPKMLLSTLNSTTTSTTTLLTLVLLLHCTHISAIPHRRLLHQPFFPLPPAPTQPPSLPPARSPPSLLKHPFSTTCSPPSSTISDVSGNNNNNDNYPFFPASPTTPPPPPPPSTTALPTFPANISSLALPSTSSPPSHSPLSSKLIITLILLSLLTLSLIISLSLLLHRRHNNRHRQYSPSQKNLTPPPPPQQHSKTNVTHTSSHDFQATTSSIETPQPEIYLKLCGDDSPELRPLPPLPKTTNNTATSSQQHLPLHSTHFNDEQHLYSPTSLDNNNFGLNISPTRTDSDSQASESDMSVEIQTLAARTHHLPARDNGRVGPQPAAPTPPPPPPPPPPGMGPPPLVPPSGPVVFKSSGNLGEKRKSGERHEESESGTRKPKLKALHWDKVRANSDRSMVWDQLQTGSFQ